MSICHDSALLPRCASVPAYCSEKHVRFFILPGRFSHTADTGRDTGTDRGRLPGSHPDRSPAAVSPPLSAAASLQPMESSSFRTGRAKSLILIYV